MPESNSRHLYAGYHSSSNQVSLEFFIPNLGEQFGFDITCFLSTPHQWFTYVRLFDSHMTRYRAFSLTLTTPIFDWSRLRLFAICTWMSIARDLLSSFVQHCEFYIPCVTHIRGTLAPENAPLLFLKRKLGLQARLSGVRVFVIVRRSLQLFVFLL